MDHFTDACALMQTQLGQDALIALATCVQNDVQVRMVNGHYKNGCIYVVTHTGSHKMQQLAQNPRVAVCKDLMNAQGTGTNLGHPKAPQNAALRDELCEAFIAFYDRHVNEDDDGTCILQIELAEAVAFSSDSKYRIDFAAKTAERIPFANDIVPL